MSEKEKETGELCRAEVISRRQMTRMLSIEGFGAAGLTLPAVACFGSSTGLYPMLLYGGFMVLLLCWLLWVVKRTAFPGEGFSGPGMTGSVFAMKKWVAGIYIFRFVINAAALFYFFGFSIQKIYMPDENLVKILLPFAFLCFYCVETTLQKRARFLEMLFPWIAVLFFAVILFSIPGIWGNLHSLTETQNLKTVVENGYFLLLCSSPLEFLVFLVPSVTENLWKTPSVSQDGDACAKSWKKTVRAVILAAAGIVLWNLLLWFCTVETIGAELTAASPWPVIKMMQLIRLPGGFLERFDILLAIYWVLCMIAVISGYLYYGRKIGEMSFSTRNVTKENEKERRWTVSVLVAAVLLLFLAGTWFLPDVKNILTAFFRYKKYVDFPLLLLLPLFLGPEKKEKNPQSRKMLCFMMVCMVFLLGGCRKQSDAEEKSYMMSLYVEKAEKGYHFTTAAADLSAMSEQSQNVPCRVCWYEAENMAGLEKEILRSQTGEPEWNHIETIFIGKELAGSPGALMTFLREWEAAWQKSPNVLLCVTELPADTLFDLKAFPKASAGQEIRRLSEQDGQEEETLLCKTPIDVIKATGEGKKEVILFEAAKKDDGITLKKALFSVVREEK